MLFDEVQHGHAPGLDLAQWSLVIAKFSFYPAPGDSLSASVALFAEDLLSPVLNRTFRLESTRFADPFQVVIGSTHASEFALR